MHLMFNTLIKLTTQSAASFLIHENCVCVLQKTSVSSQSLKLVDKRWKKIKKTYLFLPTAADSCVYRTSCRRSERDEEPRTFVSTS